MSASARVGWQGQGEQEEVVQTIERQAACDRAHLQIVLFEAVDRITGRDDRR
jgi:hypothetical protein